MGWIKFYKNRPFKDAKPQGDGLYKLFYVAPRPMKPWERCETEVISQDDWDKYVKKEFYQKSEMPDLHELARQRAPGSHSQDQ